MACHMMVSSFGDKLKSFSYFYNFNGKVVVPIFFLESRETGIDIIGIDFNLACIFKIITDLFSLDRLLSDKNEAFDMRVQRIVHGTANLTFKTAIPARPLQRLPQ